MLVAPPYQFGRDCRTSAAWTIEHGPLHIAPFAACRFRSLRHWCSR